MGYMGISSSQVHFLMRCRFSSAQRVKMALFTADQSATPETKG